MGLTELEILDFILSGAVVRAVAALNAHFPAVLNPTTAAALSALRNGAEPSHSNGASSNGAESNGAGNGTTNGASNLSPYLPQPSSSRSRTAPSTPGGAAPPPPPTNHTVPLFTRSSDPGHVKLNLSIQRYIEEMRSVPTQSATSSPSSSIDSLTGSTALSGDPFRDLMTMHQELHTEAMKLRPEHRAAYLQEIKDVTALLGYNNPETSILRGFLEQERRIALAQQVNAAILSKSAAAAAAGGRERMTTAFVTTGGARELAPLHLLSSVPRLFSAQSPDRRCHHWLIVIASPLPAPPYPEPH